MENFRIHEDAEKENPHIFAGLRDKMTTSGAINKLGNVLQPSALTASMASSAASALAAGIKQQQKLHHHQQQQQQTQRANFATLNNGKTNPNAIYPKNSTGTTFTTKHVRKDNAAENAKLNTICVYEDDADEEDNNNVEKSTTVDPVSDKPKQVLRERQIEPQVMQISLLNGSHENYALDTTPMSVTDVLSPMSVDQSSSIIDVVNDDDKPAHSSDYENNKKDMNLTSRRDRDRFFHVVEYQSDILAYFRESEQKHRPKPHYMSRQSDINQPMRTIMVDWLVEVSEEYNLDTETLYLSISYIDRFLSQMSVMRNKLQLVGTSAMYIASKYEEIYPPEVSDFVFITDDTFSKSQILRMEQIILKILSFDLCTPTPYVYINMYAAITDMDDKFKALTMYIAELTLLEADPYLRFLPSAISAAACALSNYNFHRTIWSEEMEKVTSYKLEDLKEVILCLSKTHNAASSIELQAIQEKYRAEKYFSISNMMPREVLNSVSFDILTRKYNELKIMEEQAEEARRAILSPMSDKFNDNVRRMVSLMFNDTPTKNSENIASNKH